MSPEFLPARICRNNPGTGNQSPLPGLEPLNKISLGWVSELRGTNAEVPLKGSSCQCSIGGGGVADEREREKGGRERGREREAKRGDCFYTLFNFTTTDSPPPPDSRGRSRFMAWVAGHRGPEPAWSHPLFLCFFFPRRGAVPCRLYGIKCAKCNIGFSKNDFVMRARSKVYHIECFRCVACSRQLIPGDEFALREDGLFCRADHDVVERASLGAGDPLSPLHPARPLQMAGTSQSRGKLGERQVGAKSKRFLLATWGAQGGCECDLQQTARAYRRLSSKFPYTHRLPWMDKRTSPCLAIFGYTA